MSVHERELIMHFSFVLVPADVSSDGLGVYGCMFEPEVIVQVEKIG